MVNLINFNADYITCELVIIKLLNYTKEVLSIYKT